MNIEEALPGEVWTWVGTALEVWLIVKNDGDVVTAFCLDMVKPESIICPGCIWHIELRGNTSMFLRAWKRVDESFVLKVDDNEH